MKIRLFIALICAFPVVYCNDDDGASTTLTENASTARDHPPYIQMMLCPMQKSPWSCLREQSGRLLELLDNSYKTKWSEFKDEANNEIIARFQARGFSATDKVKEKTSTIFEKIETGVSEIKDFAASTANELIGREDNEQEDEDFETDISFEEFTIDDDEDEKKKGGTGNKIKKKRKKKPHQGADITSILHDDDDESDDVELAADLLSGGGGHGIKMPHKYGRSLGVTRGKKKKKRKGIMKIILIASFLKAKIELLLKILSAHLQIKFFAISVIGLLLNLIRFWLDVKRGQAPSKVIYYEHAHHQHHYDDHDDWDQGGYWRRSNAPTTEYGAGEGLDDDSTYSRIGRNDYFPSSQGSSAISSLSSSHSKHGPIRMAYARQIPPGV